MCRPRWWIVFFLLVAPLTGWCKEDSEMSVYTLLREGTDAEIEAACRKRGLECEGGPAELKRRLLEDELRRNLLPFDERVAKSEQEDIVLRHADFIEHREGEDKEELIFLSGDVNIDYRKKKIGADEVRINVDQGIITGSGHIVFIDEYGKKYIAEEFFYDTETDEGIFFQGKTTLKKFIYSGKTIEKINESEKFVSDDVSLTTCNIKNPHYRVEAEKLYYYDSDYVLIKNASFYFGQDPLFTLPYYYRNLEEPDIKSSIFFRERAGLVLQNTYYPVKSDDRELALKGDLYERLGVYAGADFSASYPLGETEVGGSAALASDVYYYEDVTENWSPYSPTDDTDYDVNRRLRYRAGGYQKFEYGDTWENTTELNLYWASDPYYSYDFERRSEQFDIFKLIQQAEADNPRKDSGFSWYANHYSHLDTFSLSVLNTMRFMPQRNTEVDTVYLPSYYQFRIYSITAPNVTATHSDTILEGIQPEIFSGLGYSSYANYNHTAYYDASGVLSSELHRASTHVNLHRDYELLEWITLSPDIEAGVEGQRHVEPDASELSDDNRHTLVYGKTSETLQLGPSDINLQLSHTLKYKLFGPDDYYEYGRFRIHELGARGYTEFWKFTEEIYTSYDIRPY
jgi:lipopolysaccharide assembly outer membrane protein LptD (OstA)